VEPFRNFSPVPAKPLLFNAIYRPFFRLPWLRAPSRTRKGNRPFPRDQAPSRCCFGPAFTLHCFSGMKFRFSLYFTMAAFGPFSTNSTQLLHGRRNSPCSFESLRRRFAKCFFFERVQQRETLSAAPLMRLGGKIPWLQPRSCFGPKSTSSSRSRDDQ